MATETTPTSYWYYGWRTILGVLILLGGIIFMLSGTHFWHRNLEPPNLPVLKGNNDGTFQEKGTYYQQGTVYKLYRVDMPDGTWHVVAVPKDKR